MSNFTSQNDLAIILPSLDPDKKFSGVVDGLIESGFKNIVIVDDGSDAAHQHFFDEAAAFPQCRVLHHGVNKGKGRALKTAFEYVLQELPDVQGVITIDGDGQHLTQDIIACGERMLAEPDKVVLGCRDFDQPGVPPRSVAGNKTTSFFFRLLFRIRLSDTQTGLRAIPRSCLETFCGIEGERFEYETNMLLYMKLLGIGWLEQKIATVYDEEDYSSHYNAVKDSWRIFKVMFKFVIGAHSSVRYVFSSAASWVIDNALYFLLFTVFGAAGLFAGFGTSAAAHISGRVISSFANFNLNNFWVFRNKEDYGRSLLKYYCLCVPQTAVSVVAVAAIVNKLSVSAPLSATLIKVVIEAVLFCISYVIQKKWVFRKKAE